MLGVTLSSLLMGAGIRPYSDWKRVRMARTALSSSTVGSRFCSSLNLVNSLCLTKVGDKGKNRTGISFQLLVNTLCREGKAIDLMGLTTGAELLLEEEAAVAVASSLYWKLSPKSE